MAITEVGTHAVHVEVIDDGASNVPLPRTAEPSSGGGRGLFLVEHVSAKWGVRELDAGRRAVWAQVTTWAECAATGCGAG